MPTRTIKRLFGASGGAVDRNFAREQSIHRVTKFGRTAQFAPASTKTTGKELVLQQVASRSRLSLELSSHHWHELVSVAGRRCISGHP